MRDEGFYAQPKFKGREVAMQSLTFTPPTKNTSGIRLGNFTSIRSEVRSELEAIMNGQKTVEVGLNDAVARSNQILRRFEQTFRGRALP